VPSPRTGKLLSNAQSYTQAHPGEKQTNGATNVEFVFLRH
jgi:hypothetical protein